MRWYTLTWWSGGLTSDSLEGFWAVGNDPDPQIPNLPLENRNQFTCNPTASTAAVASFLAGKIYNRAYDALTAAVASIVRSTGKQIPKSLTREPLFVGSGTITGVTGSTTTFNFSSLLDEAGGAPTVLENDIVIVNNNVGAIVDLAQAVLVPSGYTAAHADLYANDSSDCNHQVSYKFMGASPDTSVVIPDPNSGSSNLAAIIHVFRYVDLVTPIDVAPTTAVASNWGIPDAPALTPQVPGHVIMVFGGASSTLMNGSLGNPSGMSGTTNHFRAAANLLALRTLNATALYYGNKGTYDPAVFAGGIASTNGSWSAITLALRPAGPYTQASAQTNPAKQIFATAANTSRLILSTAHQILWEAATAASLATNRGYQRALSALATVTNLLVRATGKNAKTTDNLISYVGGVFGTVTSSGTDLTQSLTALAGGIGSAPIENDLVIVAYGKGSSNADIGATPSIPADYTVHADLYANDTYDANLIVGSKVMTATPDTTIVIGHAQASAYTVCFAVQVWRGVDTGTPMDVAATTATGVDSGDPNPPAITPVTPGANIIVVGSAAGDIVNALGQTGELANYIEQRASDTVDTGTAMGSVVWGSGAFDPATLTNTGGTSLSSWAAATLALRPAAGNKANLGKVPTFAWAINALATTIQSFVADFIAGSSGTEYEQDVDATTVPVASLARQMGLAYLATSTAMASLSRSTTSAIAATAECAASLTRQTANYILATATTAQSIVREAGKSLLIDAAGAASIVKQTSKSLLSESALLASLTRAVAKVLNIIAEATASVDAQFQGGVQEYEQAADAQTTPVASLAKSTVKSFLIVAAVVSALLRHAGKSLAAISSPVAALSRQIANALTSAATSVASMTTGLSISTTMLANAATVASIAATTAYRKSINAAAGAVASLSLAVARAIQTATAAAASVQKQTAKSFSGVGSAVASAQSNRLYALAISKSISAIATLARIFTLAGAETLRRIRIASESARIIYVDAQRRLITIAAIFRSPAITAEDRRIAIAPEEPRHIVIAAEPTRTIRIPAESRRLDLDADQ